MKPQYIDQRTLFVDSLYAHLKKETEKVKTEYNRYASLAHDYIESGLDDSEVAELLIVDGLDRDAAKGYISMAKDNWGGEERDQEFSFVFEDVYGNVFSSHDIGKTIFASSEEEAFKKASCLTGDDSEYEIQNIISVDLI